MQDILKKYAKLNSVLKEMEMERDILKEEIIKDFKKRKVEKEETAYGNFTIGHRSSWVYSETIKKMENKIKIAKDKEQKKGTAEQSVTDYLLFKEIKNNE